MNQLQIINKSGILTEDDFKSLYNLRYELQDTFLKSQEHRTRTELDVSILNDVDYPTPASKYWQAMREQYVHFVNLIMLSYDYKKKLIENKRTENKLRHNDDYYDRELNKISIEKNNFILKTMEREAKSRIYEILNCSDIKNREAKNMTKKELENCDNHQLASYTQRWIKQAKIMGERGTPAERKNLLGQLNSGINNCIKQGILSEVIKDFSLKDQEKIYKEYNVKELV